MKSHRNNLSGFTLVEMAIALVVVGLLISGGISLLGSSSDVGRYKKTQALLSEIKESLEGFYSINLRLPCPDISNPPDGIEDRLANGVCTQSRGFLPYVTVGVGGDGDAWGQRFKYLVQVDPSKPAYVKPDSSKSSNIDEQNEENFFITKADYCNPKRVDDNSVSRVRIKSLDVNSDNYVADYLAFVVLSTGKNGAQTNAVMTSAFSADGGCNSLLSEPNKNIKLEQENCNSDSILRSGNQVSDGNSIIFDDLLVWQGDMQLLTSLRTTGVCASEALDPAKETTTNFTTGAIEHEGDYNYKDSISTSNGDDKVVITGDLEKDIELGDGNNTLLIQGSMKDSTSRNRITGGSGEDIVRIEGNLEEGIDLKGGNDQLEVFGKVDVGADDIDMGSGDDQIRFYDDVEDTKIELGTGTNYIYIKGEIEDVEINATDGTAILYYDAPTKPSRDDNLKLGSTVTIKCRINVAWTDCP